MKNRVTAVIEVAATVDVAYEHWRRTHGDSAGRAEAGDPAARVHWVVRVNGVSDEQAASTDETMGTGRFLNWAGSDGGTPNGEVTFDPLEGGGTQVSISLEWQRPDSAESYIPLIFLDGVRVNADLRSFKREVETATPESRGWEHIMQQFEPL